jgi:CheY-like chemotaxis protein
VAIAVLIVEDEALVRIDLVEALQEAGFKTFEANNAAEAIAIMETNSEIRVVFTDIEMPGTMDGLALSHYVRRRWPPTIIVISSGRHRPKTRCDAPPGRIYCEALQPGRARPRL